MLSRYEIFDADRCGKARNIKLFFSTFYSVIVLTEHVKTGSRKDIN